MMLRLQPYFFMAAYHISTRYALRRFSNEIGAQSRVRGHLNRCNLPFHTGQGRSGFWEETSKSMLIVPLFRCGMHDAN
jgi:hypothetical protein